MAHTAKQLKSLPLPLLALAVAVAAVSQANAGEPAKVKAGIVDIIPTLQLTEKHNDNIFTANSDERSSNILILNPEVRAEIVDGDNIYSITANLEEGIYNNSSDDNFTDYKIGGEALLAFNHRNKLAIAASTSEGHEDRGSGVDEGTSLFTSVAEFDLDKVSASYQLGGDNATMRLQLSAGYTDLEFTNFDDITAFRDYEKDDFGITGLYKLAPKTDIFISYNYADYDYAFAATPDQRLDNDESKIVVGVTWEATANTTGTATIGTVDKEFDSSARDDFTGTIWSLEANWKPSDRTTVTLYSQQQPTETTSIGNFIETTSTGTSWVQNWTSAISTTVSASFGEQEFDETSRDDDTENFGISLDYEFRRWMTVGIAYDYNELDSNIDIFDYDRNIYNLNLSFSL